jgi:hypothetical protein
MFINTRELLFRLVCFFVTSALIFIMMFSFISMSFIAAFYAVIACAIACVNVY